MYQPHRELLFTICIQATLSLAKLQLNLHSCVTTFSAQPGRSLTEGFSWPGVFLPRANGP